MKKFITKLKLKIKRKFKKLSPEELTLKQSQKLIRKFSPCKTHRYKSYNDGIVLIEECRRCGSFNHEWVVMGGM